MTPRQAIRLLDALGDMIEDWDDPDEYLEAIDMAQDSLEGRGAEESNTG